MGTVVLAAAVLAACQDVTGPDSPQYASLSIAPVIAPGPRPADILPIDNVRIRVTRGSGDLVQETVVPFPADSSRLSVRLRVPLKGKSEGLPAPVELRAALVVLYSGAAEVEVWAEGQGPVATSQPSLSYVGPGGQIARIQIAPRDTVLSFGDLLTLRVSAFDAGGNALPDPAVVWSMTPALTPISVAGVLTAPLVRGNVMVHAVTTSGIGDSTRLGFVPRPTALTILSGNAQQGAIGSVLGAPLAVVVKAADGLGVAGVPVRFRAISAGGSVRDAQVTTDDNGRAETVATLGSAVGAYTYEAAVTGLTAVTFTENAVAAVASALTIVSGNNQSALAGILLPSPLVVKATDAAGNPVSGTVVDWTILAGGGALGAATTTTGPDGTTQVLYTLGAVPGAATIRAALHNAPAVTVSFTETVLAGSGLALSIVSGNNQSALVGLPLTNPLVVKATDAFGSPVAGQQVNWTILSGGGVLGSATTTTGSDGTTQVLYTLGSVAGPATIRAALHSAPTTAVQFTATALAAAASALSIVSGNNQSALVGLPLPAPLVVKATDAAGRAVSGAQVDWTIVSGGGLLGSATTTTGSDGTTQVLYTLGSVAGPATIRAALHNAPTALVQFTETALSAGSNTLALVSGDNQSALVGLPLPAPLVVKATDAAGNPVSGVQVDWTILTGGGLLSSATTTTAPDGTAQVLYTLGSVAGPATIRAALHNAPSVTVSFTETALAAVASAISIVSGNNQSALVGLPLADPLVVKATDAAGRAVSGAQIDWTILSGGGVLGSATTTTGSDGTSQVLYTLGSVAGPATIRAALNNAPSVTASFTETALAAVASALTLVSGNNQSDLVGLQLTNPLVVKATDAAGRAVNGAQIDWTILSGGGVLGSATTTTGSDGTTQVLYTLGSVAGPATIRSEERRVGKECRSRWS